MTSKEIGKTLAISHRTVEIYRARLMRKYKASTTADLVHKLMQVLDHSEIAFAISEWVLISAMRSGKAASSPRGRLRCMLFRAVDVPLRECCDPSPALTASAFGRVYASITHESKEPR